MSTNLNSPTYTLSATTSSSAVTMLPIDAAEVYVEIYNGGTAAAFVVSGTGSAPTAVFPTSATVPLNGTVIAPGATFTYNKIAGHEFISGIVSTGTTTLYISPIPKD